MKARLLLLLFVLPVVEVWLLMELSRYLPLSGITGLCVSAAVFGLWLMRGEDFTLWTLVETEIQNRRLPTEELLDALLLWIAGLLLLIPGIFTDVLGLLLLVPAWRQWVTLKIQAQLKQQWQL